MNSDVGWVQRSETHHQFLSFLGASTGGPAGDGDDGQFRVFVAQVYDCLEAVLPWHEDIRDADLAHVKWLKSLTHLCFMNCKQITDKGLNRIKSLSN